MQNTDRLRFFSLRLFQRSIKSFFYGFFEVHI